MVRPLKVVALFLYGAAIIAVLAYPKATPHYYSDGHSHLYHGDRDCAYGHLVTFQSRKEAEAAELQPCSKCLPELGEKVAQHANGNYGSDTYDKPGDKFRVHAYSPQ